MAISGIQSGQDVYSTPFAQENSNPLGGEPPMSQTTKSDTVHISEEAKELAQKNQAENIQGTAAAGQSDKVLPLRAYSIPGWMGDLMPRHAKADTQLGQPYLESNGALRDALSPSAKDDLSEYMHTLSTFYNEESRSRGIENAEDYYNSIVLNKKPGLSEELRQAVEQRLTENSRMMELMKEFGVTV